MAVKNTLFQYWKHKELELGRSITIPEIANATGLHRETVANLLEGRTTRFDAPVIDKICEFFSLPSGPIPFLIYEPTSKEDGSS
jgi:hypothetical protein